MTPANELFVMGFPPDGRDRGLILDPATGALRREVDFTQFTSRPGYLTGLFLGPDKRMYAATRDGLFGYDPDGGLGYLLLAISMREPRVRGRDLFFLHDDYTVGMAPGFFG